MKFFVQICVIFAIIAAANASSSTWGVRNATDSVIISKNVFYPGIRNVTQTFYLDIPESNQNNGGVISVIYVQDQFRNTSGPTNSLLNGGPGWTFASVEMKTQRSYGLNVTYMVYAKTEY